VRKLLSTTAVFVFCLAAVALAQSRPVSVSNAWARASNVSTGAVYLTITNSGGTDDKLVAAQSPVAKTVQMHIETDDNGIMKMRQLHAIDVQASGKATLAPGGMHLMLIGLKHHLMKGQTFPLTLTFENAGKIDVTVAVKEAGSMGGMKM
jgi:periplasmic copper chaperone A